MSAERGEEIEEVVDEILSGKCKRVPLHTLVSDWIADDESAARTIAAAIASDSLSGLREDPVFRQRVQDEAEAEYERREKQMQDDAGEAQYEARQDAMHDFRGGL